ncbi:MAG: hypothetical protein ACTILW_03140, partial [Leuconostoc carnosum]|uniref:hypothetical protein n=1 Tax=Leuconostoc carnosum TaxID=1252 RepID=UPI003F99D995
QTSKALPKNKSYWFKNICFRPGHVVVFDNSPLNIIAALGENTSVTAATQKSATLLESVLKNRMY